MKSVVITGSARGFGLCQAKKFKELGFNVVISNINETNLKKVLEELKKINPENTDAIGVVCDVKKRQDHEKLWKKAKEVFGTVDIWVNNAGVNSPDKPVYELTDKEKTLRVRKALLLDLFVIHYPVCHNQAESS